MVTPASLRTISSKITYMTPMIFPKLKNNPSNLLSYFGAISLR